ncbi:MAG: protein kinase [Planctomycetota bacterium]|nr:protein kinase [Planctomycetota bacterium]
MAVYLRIIHGPGSGQVLPIPSGQPVSLGRSGASSYAFDDPLLSRKHCAVECRGDLCRIVDLQSRNGTFVNGQRVGAQLLRLGDRIKIGNVVFEVCPVGAQPIQPPPSMTGGRPVGAPGPGALGQTVSVAPQQNPIAPCQVCGKPLGNQGGRELRGKVACVACIDRYDVEEDLVEGFRLVERLEVNSHGVTYLAQQKLMGRMVVLKTIQIAGDEDGQKAMRRFLREAKTGGRLQHPNIVELYDVNEQAGLMYIVTEHVEGDSLDKLLRERGGPLPGPQVTRAMLQIAEALHYAHEQQIIHRDVKPANVLVRRADGRAKLQGFSLAKNLERAPFSVITADGESLGTPYYMPPEQVRSAKNVDQRCDIYSWGATTYHCLSGHLPLESRSYGEFIEKVFSQDAPPIERWVPSVPRPLATLVGRTLKREPAERPQSMGDVVQELEAIVRALPA